MREITEGLIKFVVGLEYLSILVIEVVSVNFVNKVTEYS